MLKKISVLALAGMLCLPAAAFAGGGSGDLARKMDDLTRQLEQLKRQMADMQEVNEEIEEKAESWDNAARFHWSGDFRARYDFYTRERKTSATASVKDTNDSLFTNRLRLNVRVKATENMEFKGRLAMYKAWGMQSTPGTAGDFFGAFPPFDGNSTRQPSDSTLKVDRAFVNWNNIADMPIWFSIGRRPTTDGPPNHIKLGNEGRMATAAAVMDWPFDGLSVGYAYNNLFGMEDAPGRIRFCYGRGFEEGYNPRNTSLNDTDFAGLSWDIYKKGDRFVYLQSFAAFEVFNYPDWSDGATYNITVDGVQYTEAGRLNVGNIYHTTAVYMDKWQNLNYFGAGSWSQTAPNQSGMLNDYTGPGAYTANTDRENGYHLHLGVRYDFPEQPFKVGFEYNYGSEYWIAMTPGHDDMYASKLAVRGDAIELYGIWDLPTGEAVSKYGKTFVRVGYQHYEYDYTGSMDWNVKPYDVDAASSIASAGYAGQQVITDADQIYVTLETYF